MRLHNQTGSTMGFEDYAGLKAVFMGVAGMASCQFCDHPGHTFRQCPVKKSLSSLMKKKELKLPWATVKHEVWGDHFTLQEKLEYANFRRLGQQQRAAEIRSVSPYGKFRAQFYGGKR